MSSTKGQREKGRRKGKKDGIHLVLQSSNEPSKTDNRTRAGHVANLDSSN